MSTNQNPHPEADPKELEQRRQDYRSVVHVFKRGKTAMLTLNGGTLFVDGQLALDLATRHVHDLGYRKAVIQTLKLDGGYYVEHFRITVTPPKKTRAAKGGSQ